MSIYIIVASIISINCVLNNVNASMTPDVSQTAGIHTRGGIDKTSDEKQADTETQIEAGEAVKKEEKKKTSNSQKEGHSAQRTKPSLKQFVIDELASPYNKGAIKWIDESNGIFKVRDKDKFVEAWYQWKKKNIKTQEKTKVPYENILRAIRKGCDIVKTRRYGDHTFQIVQTDKSSYEKGSAGVRPIRQNIKNRRAKGVDQNEIDELWDKDDTFASDAEQALNSDGGDSSSEEEFLCSNAKNCDECKQCKATAIARHKYAVISANVRPIRRNIKNGRAKGVDHDERDELWDKDDSFASDAKQASNSDGEDSSSEEEFLCSNAKNGEDSSSEKEFLCTAIARQKNAVMSATFPHLSRAMAEYEAKKVAKATAKLRRAQQINTKSGRILIRGPGGAIAPAPIAPIRLDIAPKSAISLIVDSHRDKKVAATSVQLQKQDRSVLASDMARRIPSRSVSHEQTNALTNGPRLPIHSQATRQTNIATSGSQPPIKSDVTQETNVAGSSRQVEEGRSNPWVSTQRKRAMSMYPGTLSQSPAPTNYATTASHQAEGNPLQHEPAILASTLYGARPQRDGATARTETPPQQHLILLRSGTGHEVPIFGIRRAHMSPGQALPTIATSQQGPRQPVSRGIQPHTQSHTTKTASHPLQSHTPSWQPTNRATIAASANPDTERRRAPPSNTDSGVIHTRGSEVTPGDPQAVVGSSVASGDSTQAEPPAKRPRTDSQARPESPDCDA